MVFKKSSGISWVSELPDNPRSFIRSEFISKSADESGDNLLSVTFNDVLIKQQLVKHGLKLWLRRPELKLSLTFNDLSGKDQLLSSSPTWVNWFKFSADQIGLSYTFYEQDVQPQTAVVQNDIAKAGLSEESVVSEAPAVLIDNCIKGSIKQLDEKSYSYEGNFIYQQKDHKLDVVESDPQSLSYAIFSEVAQILAVESGEQVPLENDFHVVIHEVKDFADYNNLKKVLGSLGVDINWRICSIKGDVVEVAISNIRSEQELDTLLSNQVNLVSMESHVSSVRHLSLLRS